MFIIRYIGIHFWWCKDDIDCIEYTEIQNKINNFEDSQKVQFWVISLYISLMGNPFHIEWDTKYPIYMLLHSMTILIQSLFHISNVINLLIHPLVVLVLQNTHVDDSYATICVLMIIVGNEFQSFKAVEFKLFVFI